MNGRVRESAAAWRALAALSALFFVITAGTFSSLGVALPDMVKAMKWDWTGAGLGFTLLGLATGLASYAPALATRLAGVRAALAAGAAITAAGFLCLFGAQSLPLYWLGACLLGIGFALCAIIPSTFVLARAFRSPPRAFGLYFTAGGLGGVAGPWLYLAAAHLGEGWRAYWLSLAIAVLVAGVMAVLSAAPPEAVPPPEDKSPVLDAAPRVHRTTVDWSTRAALRTPQFWIVTGAYTTYLLCEVTVNGISVQHLTDRGTAFTVAGAMLSLQALISVFARALGGLASEKIDPRKLVIAAMAALAVGISALAMAHSLPMMLVYALGVGAGYGLSYVATAILLLNYFGRSRNLELFSLMCLVSTLASAGPFVGGLVHDRFGGFAPALWACAGAAALALVAVTVMRPPQPRPEAT